MNQEPLATHSSMPVLRPGRMWIVWMLFFFQYAGVGIYFTYLNVFYRESGMNGTQIGVLNMVGALVGVGGVIFWGYMSDRTGKPRLLIAGGMAAAVLSIQVMPYLHSFGAFLLLSVVFSIFFSSTSSLVDSTALAILGERREDYGRYRMGGSFGYILATSSVGFLFDRIGLRAMFPTYGVVMLGFILFALMLPNLPVRLGERSQGVLIQMIRRPAWLLFAAVVFLIWIATNSAISFLSVSLQAMGAKQGLIGIAVVTGTIVEIPFMFYSPHLLRRFGSERLLMIAIVLAVVRFFLLGWMPSPEWAIPINILNGPAFVFFWNSAVTYANKMAPPNLAGTTQGLLSSLTALAGVVSSLLSGWLFDLVGPTNLYIVMGFICLAGLILFVVGNLRSTSATREVI